MSSLSHVFFPSIAVRHQVGRNYGAVSVYRALYAGFVRMRILAVHLLALSVMQSASAGYVYVEAGGSSAARGNFNPLGEYGLFATKAASYQSLYQSGNSTVSISADAAVYGGRGIEPMVFTQIDYQISGSKVTAQSAARAEMIWEHWVVAGEGAPNVSSVPVILDFRVGQEETNGLAEASVYVCGSLDQLGSCTAQRSIFARSWTATGGTTSSSHYDKYRTQPWVSVDYVDHMSVDMFMAPNWTYWIQLKAKSTVIIDKSTGSFSAQSIVDPLLMVDPDWAYANFFHVEQRKSLYDASGVPVTRDWMPVQEVPEPSMALLMLVALPVLGFLRRRSMGDANGESVPQRA